MFKRSLFLLAALICLSFAENPATNDAVRSKRTALDFEAMHTKTDWATPEHGLVKRAPIGFVEEIYKRAPMGFQGMRGKKEYWMPDFHDTYFKEYDDKRGLMGFQGMRGKKSLEEVLDEIDKRRTMGFQGMPGKKKVFPVEWEKRAPMGYQGMKTFYDEMIGELEKRAIAGGFQFQGPQGREYVNDNYLDYGVDPIDYEKRVPMSFQEFRGKKDGDKRAPMGFQGMRGKRNLQVYGIYEKAIPTGYQGDANERRNGVSSYKFEKRSPLRYFGTRGKKNPRWELRGKFVGVRGKRWATAPYMDRGSPKNIFEHREHRLGERFDGGIR